MISIGVDLGKKGAIVGLDEQYNLKIKEPMPLTRGKKKEYDISSIAKIFWEYAPQTEPVIVIVEQAIIHPVSGKISTASTHRCFGFIEGLLCGLELPYMVVRPSEWQKSVLKGLGTKDSKQASILFCKRRFPHISLLCTPQCTQDSDGIADALCMAYYGLRA